MDTGAETDMTKDFSFDVIFVGILPLARIAIGRPEEQKDLPPLLESHAAEFGATGRSSEKGLHWGFESYRVFKGRFSAPHGIRTRLFTLRWIAGQCLRSLPDAM